MEGLRRLQKDSNGGSVLVGVMMAMTVCLILLSSLLSVSRMEYRRALAGVQKREGYYASLAAVRLAAAGIISGEWEATEKTVDAELVFLSTDGDKEVRIPVQIWCRMDGDTMFLTARTDRDGKEDGISLTLRAEDGIWIPVRYAFGWKKEEDAK